MVNIKNIVIDAWKTAGLIGEYDTPDGQQSQLGINELNDIIYALNLDNYLPFTRNTIISAVNPQESYSIGASGCDITAPTPVLIRKVYVKTSQNASYNELKRVAYEEIFSFKSIPNAAGIPIVYSYDRTWPNGRIVFDLNPQPGSILTIIYNKELPEVTLNTVLDIPNEYNDLFKNTLAATLMRRFKVDPQMIGLIDGLANATMDKIKSRNSVDKMITYGGRNNSALAMYYNIMSPREWQ